MMRTELIQKTLDVLEEFNFNVLMYLHSCMDMAAQKKSLTLLLKVLENIDGFRPGHADELKRLGNSLNACPLLVGGHTKTEKLLDDTIYDRHGVNSISLNTLRNTLAGAYPEKIYSRGRVIAEIDGNLLKKARTSKTLTAEQLADEVKLTKESIYLYESDKMRTKYDIAKKVENFLNTQLIRPQKPFELAEIQKQKPSSELEKRLLLFDFDVSAFHKLNFDLIAKDPKYRVVMKQEISKHPDKLVEFSDFFKSFLAFVSEDDIKDLPVIHRDELKEVGSKREFLSLLRERSKMHN